MLSFAMRDAKAAERVVDSVKLCTLGVSLGDVATLIQVSGAMTQASLGEAATSPTIPPGLIRLSVGLESVDDIIHDVETAM